MTSLASKTHPDGRVLSLIEFQQSQLEEVTKSVEILKNCNGELKEGIKIVVSEIKDLKNQLKVEREYTRGLLLKEAAAAYKDLLLLSLDEREKGHMDKTTNLSRRKKYDILSAYINDRGVDHACSINWTHPDFAFYAGAEGSTIQSEDFSRRDPSINTSPGDPGLSRSRLKVKTD